MHPRSPPWKRVIACQGNVRPVALKTSDRAPEDSARHAGAAQARLPPLRIGRCRGLSSICLSCLGKRRTMKSLYSLIGVNITSSPDLQDSCWIDNPEVPPIARCSPDRSLLVGMQEVAFERSSIADGRRANRGRPGRVGGCSVRQAKERRGQGSRGDARATQGALLATRIPRGKLGANPPGLVASRASGVQRDFSQGLERFRELCRP